MKRYRALLCLFFSLFLTGCLWADAALNFDDYFENQTMRVDYYHMANKTDDFITIDRIYRQGPWAGNPNSLIDPFDNGKYYAKVYDTVSGKLIFSKGFNSYCSEYKTTDAAAKGIKRTYHESALIPFPKQEIKFTLEQRDKRNRLCPMFEQIIDPKSIEINRESLAAGVTVIEILKNGNPHNKVDIAFAAEGYTEAEKEKFIQDLKKIADLFFTREPYKSRKKSFNIYGVFKPSKESGPDEPTHGIFKNTAVGASFNAMGVYRYMLTEENRALRDIAAHVPYDAILIMVNSKRYGGGGIYNNYCVFTLNDEWHSYLMFHEFGHSFVGLADEYYASTVAYNEFYPTGVEPTEPNITALLDPQKLKWKKFVTKGIAIPTPWEKEKYDKMDKKQQKIHLAGPGYKDKVGAFEGAGYSSKGLYRPMIDCLMFSKGERPYCKVCEEAIIQMINYYTNRLFEN